MGGWFQVDKDGLRKIIENRGKHIIIFELIQNAWDTDATEVTVSLSKLPGTPYAKLTVEDDHPDGFKDLSHAYTLFAESEKKGDPTKRGFMNLGEKLVLALCRRAEVRSTRGSVRFNEDGSMKRGRKKTEYGSIFEAEVRLNQKEFDEVVAHAKTLIPPSDCKTILKIEGVAEWRLFGRQPIAEFEIILPTNVADAEGVMKRTKRKTMVQIFDPLDNENASIYEMGIPVVDTGDRYHVNVMQKVPINMNRDNVPPSYLRKVRAAVLNRTASLLSKDESKETWVTNALESDDIEGDAVNATLDKRFGKKRAVFDPSDPEANMHLTSAGYSVIHGSSLPKAAWGNIRRTGAAKPSGQIRPTPRPYSDDPNAPTVDLVPREEWNRGMEEVAELARAMASSMIGKSDLLVRFVKHPNRRFRAMWADGLDWNINCLGFNFFDDWSEHPGEVLGTIIHEFAHKYASNHLDENFHRACTRLGGQLAVLIAKGDLPHLNRIQGFAQP